MIDSGEGRSDRGRRTGTRVREEMSHQQGFSPGRLRMRRFCAGAGKRLMACFLLLGLAGSSPSPSPSPAEIVFAVSVGERRFIRRAGLVFHGERIAGRPVE